MNVNMNSYLNYRLANKISAYLTHEAAEHAYEAELTRLTYKVQQDKASGLRASRKDNARIKQLKNLLEHDARVMMMRQRTCFRSMLEGAAAVAPEADGLQAIRISTLWHIAVDLARNGMTADVALALALENPRSYIMSA